MIFADSTACVVTRELGQKWLKLHFHRACYVAWERMEDGPPAPPADKVTTLSSLRRPDHRDDR
jgi:hypothetical protein